MGVDSWHSHGVLKEFSTERLPCCYDSGQNILKELILETSENVKL